MLKPITWGIALAIAGLILVACAPPQTLPKALTPIPTLIPATSPAGDLTPAPTSERVVESYPAGLPSAADGKMIYDQNCASCHGPDGQGLVPNARNFRDVDYMRGETPVEIYTVITEGRGNEMPAFGDVLTSDERWDVVYYVWRLSTDEDHLQRGEHIYQANCVDCHGESGRSMILGAADLSDPRFLSNLSPSDLYLVVTQGIGSMPAWQARLSQDERWDVIDYLRTFTYDPSVSAESTLPTQEQPEASRPECEPYVTQSNPFEWDQADAVSAGQALYASCAGCHGEDGSGGAPGAPDFTSPVFQGNLRSNSGEMLCSVAEGLNAMPGWKGTLNEEQMWQLLSYIGNLGP